MLIFTVLLPGNAALADANPHVTAAGSSAFGILPTSLGTPQQCHWADGRALNGGSYSDGLIVVGDAVCPTEEGRAEAFPYYWEPGGWVSAPLPDPTFYDGYIAAVSDNPAEPVMVYSMWRSDGDAGTQDGLALLVAEAGTDPVELAPLEGMKLVFGSAAISANGNVVVAHSATGDWETGYTFRAVRWVRTAAGWSAAQDIGEGTAVAASAEGTVIVGNGDGETSGVTGGKGWVWTADGNGSGVVTPLGDDARVRDISQDGTFVIGSRPEPCNPEQWCEYFSVPVYWAQEAEGWVLHDLPTIDGTESNVVAVAEVDGQLVILGEWLFFDNFTIRAGVWLPDGSGAYDTPLMLETLGANPDSLAFAFDINREGIVLGWSEFEPWGEGAMVIWSLSESIPFAINSGLGDAWFNPATDGQGFFINVWEDSQTMFVGWFTYNADGSGRNWMTAQGPYAEGRAELTVTQSEGGVFDAGQPAPTRQPDGTMTVEFRNCLEGSVIYDIPSIGRQGSVPIQRIARGSIVNCEKRAAGAQ